MVWRIIKDSKRARSIGERSSAQHSAAGVGERRAQLREALIEHLSGYERRALCVVIKRFGHLVASTFAQQDRCILLSKRYVMVSITRIRCNRCMARDYVPQPR
jgi:hypothetical protein